MTDRERSSTKGDALFSTRRLSEFSGAGYDKGRPKSVQALWVLTSTVLVERIWCPSSVRAIVLRRFGASVGSRVLIRQGVRIHWPWKLIVGDDVWIGVDAWLLNLEPITIESNVCISQEAMLCTGSHKADDPAFEFDNAPIHIAEGAWVAARATVLRGVSVGRNSVVGAMALVTRDVPDDTTVLAPQAQMTSKAPKK
ncbi:DapH/DapD/GlmU-related protein [Arthrobacter sp. PsM3]|uniref:DapH/DapD/GlmU-related protein n=1 Tax=Arthrobacter sp. PsM3 TaxID=3030531 RepID=UPI00263AF15C|nr:DapH/DapD/GlmU-related protein [Arthrobacter sp. PsM3]MDN4645143.1 DapH/DapD/GlmU-related protein [Arthrobacter sp. PsM3]